MRVEQIGAATLYLADCREVLPGLAPVDAVVTDPPYGIPHGFRDWILPEDGCRRRLSFGWDTPETTPMVVEACRLAAPLAPAHIWFAGLHQITLIADLLLAAGLTPKPAVWVKPYPPPPLPGNWWPSGCEFACYAYRRGAWFGDDDPRRSNVWRCDTYRHGQPGKVDHPTQKPLALMGRLIRAACPPGGVVLDPFAGSGSTGVAALAAGRSFVGIECDPSYFDLACKRLDAESRQGILLPG